MCMALSLSHSDGTKTAHGKSACNAEELSSILETYIQSQMCWCAPVISEHIDPWGCCPAGLISSSRPMRDCIKTQGGDWRATAMAKRVLAQLSQRTQVWFLALILVILQLTVISIPEDMMLFQQSLSLSLLQHQTKLVVPEERHPWLTFVFHKEVHNPQPQKQYINSVSQLPHGNNLPSSSYKIQLNWRDGPLF